MGGVWGWATGRGWMEDREEESDYILFQLKTLIIIINPS